MSARRAAVVVVAGATVLMGGCAVSSHTLVAPVGPAVAPPIATVPAETPAPATASETRRAAPDVSLTAIRSAPAACGVPVHALTGGRGRVGDVETLLQNEEGYGGRAAPVRPVEADVTDDGGQDLVGVLSCTRGGEALPDHLVLYTDVATPVASVDLASVQKQRSAIVRGLRVEDGLVVVEWTAFDRVGGPVTQYRGTVRPSGGTLTVVGVRTATGPRTVTVDAGAFFTPDGNVRCVVQNELAWCDVARTNWRPPSPPAPSTATWNGTATPAAPTSPSTPASTTPPSTTSPAPEAGCGTRPYGRTFLVESGRARRTCAGEQGPEVAALGQPLTAWHRSGWDGTVTVDGRRSAVLNPGSVMRTSAVRCTTTTQAATCTDTRSGESFTAGRAVARIDRR